MADALDAETTCDRFVPIIDSFIFYLLWNFIHFKMFRVAKYFSVFLISSFL